jgi:hypothetical protein
MNGERSRAQRHWPVIKAKDYVAAVDVLVEMGRLSPKDYGQWRLGKIPALNMSFNSI